VPINQANNAPRATGQRHGTLSADFSRATKAPVCNTANGARQKRNANVPTATVRTPRRQADTCRNKTNFERIPQPRSTPLPHGVPAGNLRPAPSSSASQPLRLCVSTRHWAADRNSEKLIVRNAERTIAQFVRDYLKAHPGAANSEIARALKKRGIITSRNYVAKIKIRIRDSAKKAASGVATGNASNMAKLRK